MGSINGRRRYIVTFLIVWAHTQDHRCTVLTSTISSYIGDLYTHATKPLPVNQLLSNISWNWNTIHSSEAGKASEKYVDMFVELLKNSFVFMLKYYGP